jgi:hypothetical protein
MTMPRDPFATELPSRQREIRLDDLRLAWRDACADLRLAYLSWVEAATTDKRAAYVAHLAASDREAAAAAFYSRHLVIDAVAA